MRRAVAGLGFALLCCPPLLAQEQDRSLERISLALQQPAPFVDGLFSPDPGSAPRRTIGPFTLVPPTGRGEIIRVSLPIGELVTSAFKQVAAANRRHQEAAARRRVEAALREFAEQRQLPPR